MPAYRLNLPPSANALRRPALISPVWCSGCGRTVHGRADIREVATGEAKAFRRHAHSRLPKKLLDGPVEVLATYYLEGLSSDGPNRTKALHDALQEFLFYNDCQVAEIHEVYLFADKHHPPGVVFQVEPADPVTHAERARRLAKSRVQERANAAAQPSLPLPTNETPKKEVRPVAFRRPAHIPGESQLERITRLAKSAVINNRSEPDDEPPEAA